jgi:predicted RND superfamily exporter protein
MERFAAFIRKRSLWIILAILAVSTYSVTSLFRIEYNDDITAFFPENSREVTLFKDVSDEFGGLDIALVGIETKDVFTLANLKMLRQISRQLKTIEGIGSVTSLTEMRDFEEKKLGGETGSLIQDLVGDLPDDMTGAQLKALREKVMSRDHVVGSVISKKGDAALIICKLERSRSLWEITRSIKDAVDAAVGDRTDVKVYYGGAPFISAYISEGTQSDVKRLSPWVALAVVLIIFGSFRSIWAALLALVALIFGLIITMGFMPILELPMDLVSTSLPMILASVGSAYGIHLLARYFRILSLRGDSLRADAVRDTLREVGVPVIMAGVTTIVGFASFLVMDIKPLRNFGFMMAVGVFVTLSISVLFIASVLNRVRLGRPGRGESGDLSGEILHGIALRLTAYPKTVVALSVLVGAVSFYCLGRISTETNTKSYFPDDSEPVRSDEFMVNRFGGSLFLQLYVQGDIKSPLVLKEMQKMEDAVARIEGVTEVQSVTMPIALASAAMTGKEEIPPYRDQVTSLVYLVEDDPAVHLLVHKSWKSALTQVRVVGFDTREARRVAGEIHAYLSEELRPMVYSVSIPAVSNPDLKARLLKDARFEAAARITTDLEKTLGKKVEAKAVAKRVSDALGDQKAACSDELRARVDAVLNRDLIDDELIYIDECLDLNDLVKAACNLLVTGSIDENSLYWLFYSFATEEEKTMEEESLRRFESEGGSGHVTGFRKGTRLVLADLKDDYARHMTDAILAPYAGDMKEKKPDRYRKLAAKVIQHLSYLSTGEVAVGDITSIPRSAVTAAKKVDVQVTGYPFLYQRMNDSVLTNQVKSILVALAIIFVLLSILFRSLIIGLIASFPAVLTLLVVFGGLGLTGVPMDMGVSMVSIIALGASVDYPIHFFWRYREVASEGFEPALLKTMKTTGRAIALNALEVIAGFGLLLFAVITPVRKAGGLIALTLAISAAATLFLMPVMIRLGGRRVEEKLRQKNGK